MAVLTLEQYDAIRANSTRARAKYLAAKTGCCALCMRMGYDHKPGGDCPGEFWDSGFVWKFEYEFKLARDGADTAVQVWVSQMRVP